MALPIDIDTEAVAAFCRRHHVRKFSFFGSVLRDDFDPERSDVDVLVEFEAGSTPGYFTIARMCSELEAMLGRSVDLLTPQGLSDRIRDRVLDSAEVSYAADTD